MPETATAACIILASLGNAIINKSNPINVTLTKEAKVSTAIATIASVLRTAFYYIKVLLTAPKSCPENTCYIGNECTLLGFLKPSLLSRIVSVFCCIAQVSQDKYSRHCGYSHFCDNFLPM
jgi:hypothetical protein